MAAACGFSEILMTGEVLGSLSEILHDSAKPTRLIAEKENNSSMDCEKRYMSINNIEGHVIEHLEL